MFAEKNLRVSIDTRTIKPGDIFFAIKGDTFDGNTFAIEALDRGASFVVSENRDMPMDDRCILVDDSLKALQELASIHREHLGIPIIAITGSNGKTTTKELTRVVLEKKYRTLASPASFNNHIGVPLTILSIKPEHQIVVLEMGDNHEGEIARLCEVARPTHGLITNIGRDHIGEAGGYEANIRAKLELYDFFKKFGGVNFLNNDDPMLVKNSLELNNSKYAMGEILDAEDLLTIRIDGKEIKTHFVGGYNIDNFLAAYTIGRHFDVPTEDIVSALEDYEPKNNRSQKIKSGTNTIIMDAYNANPDSMKLALENFALMKTDKKKIVILGDMFDMGEFASEVHKEIMVLAETLEFDHRYFVGAEFYKILCMGAPVFGDEILFETTDDLVKYLRDNKIENSFVLLKGSRGMALEKILKENLI
jgi:UDP-N-acetylmuramoyl-tripeptide--D-alanyl-D-alanine ligase